MIWYQASFPKGESIFSQTLSGLSNNSTAQGQIGSFNAKKQNIHI